MGGAWVFPGGALGNEDAGLEHTGLRELQEEAGLELSGTDDLVPFSRWITPTEVKVRFDTLFYLAESPPGAEPVCDGEECVDLRWIRPGDALEAARREE